VQLLDQNRDRKLRVIDFINNKVPIEKYDSEVHFSKEVPFSGSVYHELGIGITSKEIHEKYIKSTPSIFWIIKQSLVLPFSRFLH